MKAHRIVANIQTADVAKAEVFYHDEKPTFRSLLGQGEGPFVGGPGIGRFPHQPTQVGPRRGARW